MIKWIDTNNYIYGYFDDVFNSNTLKNKKIACFDLDDTLIKKDFTQNLALYNISIPKKLLEYHNDGFKIVIVSNQKGMSGGKVNMTFWKNKIQNLRNLLGIDFYIFCSKLDDLYRKPRTKLWDEFISGNVQQSFFCGDAGGLPKTTIYKTKLESAQTILYPVVSLPADFSDSDRKFALNVGIRFIHRNEFVFGENYSINSYPKFDYINFDEYTDENKKIKFEPKEKEMILTVGFPASGKSTFRNKLVEEHGYVAINQDTLKTETKCIKLLEDQLKLGKCVIVDNTNLTKAKRKLFIDIAKFVGYSCRCVIFNTPLKVCEHNSYFRNYITDGKSGAIPKLVYNVMNKKLEKPDLSEGFTEIISVDFTLNDMNQDLLKLYRRYYY
jgi:bifunctional polynucleotide phosphatase/kinase